MRSPVLLRAALLSGFLAALVVAPGAATVADAASDLRERTSVMRAEDTWTWPVEGPRIVLAPFRAPVHTWSAGHRGMDVAASVGGEVRAPEHGTVAFRGVVVDRPLLTITHAGGLVTTLEPVESDLEPGDVVSPGTIVGTLATGGHAASGALHVGVRWHGAYINPMLLFGGVPRAVLLPCCAPSP